MRLFSIFCETLPSRVEFDQDAKIIGEMAVAAAHNRLLLAIAERMEFCESDEVPRIKIYARPIIQPKASKPANIRRGQKMNIPKGSRVRKRK